MPGTNYDRFWIEVDAAGADEKPMRRPLLLGSVVALIGTGLLLLDRQLTHVETTWARMLHETEHLRLELESLPSRRSVLWGEPIAGNAAADYRQALELTKATRDADTQQLTWIKTLAKSGAEAAEPARERFATTLSAPLASLVSGAHRSSCGWYPDWSKGLSHPVSNLLVERQLANAAVATAMGAARTGRDQDAVHLLLDAAQFGRDGAHRMQTIEELIGLAILGIATHEALLERGLLATLAEPALEELLDGLRRLDEDFETAGRGQRGDAVLAGFHMRRDPTPWSDALDLGPISAWREGFSHKLVIGKVQLAAIGLARTQSGLALEAEPVAARRGAAAGQEFLRTGGPLADRLLPAHDLARNRRDAIARLRLLRMLLALHLGQAPAPLADPFGGTLHAEREADGRLRAWSAWAGHRPPELVFDPTPPAATAR